ncbi:MAG: hypothetical protein FWC70_08490 [Defluviitaleaceae bacterium]|nr:hypothetical protein [Defluviitaleaceae bacterium]
MKLNNMKIRSKVTVGFAIVFLLGAAIVFLSMMNTMSVRNDFMYLQQYPTERYALLSRFDAGFNRSKAHYDNKIILSG